MVYLDVLCEYIKNTKAYRDICLLGADIFSIPVDLTDSIYNDKGVVRLDLELKLDGNKIKSKTVTALYVDTHYFSGPTNEYDIHQVFYPEKVVIVSNVTNMESVDIWYYTENVEYSLDDLDSLHITYHDVFDTITDDLINKFKICSDKSLSLSFKLSSQLKVSDIQKILLIPQIDEVSLYIDYTSLGGNYNAVDYFDSLFNDLNHIGFFDTKKHTLCFSRRLVLDNIEDDTESCVVNSKWIKLLDKFLTYTDNKVRLD